jgi:hypothetical protein
VRKNYASCLAVPVQVSYVYPTCAAPDVALSQAVVWPDDGVPVVAADGMCRVTRKARRRHAHGDGDCVAAPHRPLLLGRCAAVVPQIPPHSRPYVVAVNILTSTYNCSACSCGAHVVQLLCS